MLLINSFFDASTSAFAAVLYFKSVVIKIVTSNSRVVPLNKTYTIPRLGLGY